MGSSVIRNAIGMKCLPYDASLLFNETAEFDEIKWPINADGFRDIILSSLKDFLVLATEAETEMHRSALLMSLLSANQIWAYIEKAICVQHERDNGYIYLSSSPIISFLREEEKLPDTVGALPKQISSPTPPRYPTIRSIINTYKMNNWWMIPFVGLLPKNEVGSSNSLLVDFNKSQNSRSVYRDTNHKLVKIRENGGASNDPNLSALVINQLCELFLSQVELDDRLKSQLGILVRHQVSPLVNQIVQDLIDCRNAKNISLNYWAGTAGRYSSRLMSLETMRRGGTVTRFDHAGSLAFLQQSELFAALELATCNKYVMGSKRQSELVKQSGVLDLIAPIRDIEIVDGPGFSYIDELKLTRSKSPPNRPRVMYLSSFSNSETKGPAHYLSQIIYQDWSVRLIQQLSKMPVELVCKPHPDSGFATPGHPVSRYAKIVNTPFEDVINDADIFIFDCLNSTAFWEAVCTDKKIICIDVGVVRPTQNALPILKRRCTFLKASFDDSNRLQISDFQLRESLLDNTTNSSPNELLSILTCQ